MSNTTTRKRLFPAYTLEELESWKDLDATTANKVAEEIKARKNGESVAKSTPQVSWSEVTIAQRTI